jgi:molybdenum cofactor cytidylyltransferase
MKFGPISVEQAKGKILGHNIAGSDGRRALRKGHPLTTDQLEVLHQLGRVTVYVAELEPGDVDENMAALRVARAAMGAELVFSGPSTGRVNLKAASLGVLRVDASRLAQLNACDGITLATMRSHTAVEAGKIVATVKVIPFALPERAVTEAEAIAATGGPLIGVDRLETRKVALILSGSETARSRILSGFDPPLRRRLEALGATIESVDFVPLEDERGEAELALTLKRRLATGAQLILLAGETAIMDRYDIAPRAVDAAGGRVTCFGAPVDPGNLLMVAYLGEVPVLGAPGCARSPKLNVIDWVLPRLLVGDQLTHADIYTLGHGGLLEDVAERPMPRNRL